MDEVNSKKAIINCEEPEFPIVETKKFGYGVTNDKEKPPIIIIPVIKKCSNCCGLCSSCGSGASTIIEDEEVIL